MKKYARSCTGVLALVIAGSLVALPASTDAQEDEGPGNRILTVTSFRVPFNHRPQVFPFMVERVLPQTQLNPHVLNFRVMLHNWGGNASDVVIVAEYDDIADIEADCGQPCDDYYEAHPAPEEGEEGYEEFQEAQELFNKYYAHHKDEIYTSPMGLGKVEGEMMGPVGGPEADDAEGGEEEM